MAMTLVITEATGMAKKKAPARETDRPMGPIVAKNLSRIGLTSTSVNTAEVARLVTAKTGKSMSRQRVASILNQVKISDRTIEMLAKAVGLKPDDLLKDD